MDTITYKEALADFATALDNEAAAKAECDRLEKELNAAVHRLFDLRQQTADARIILNKCARRDSKPTVI